MRTRVTCSRATRACTASSRLRSCFRVTRPMSPRPSDVCARLRVPMLPRGAGTSLAGQTVGRAVIIDTSRHMDAHHRSGPRAPSRASSAGRRPERPQSRCAQARPALRPRYVDERSGNDRRHDRQQLRRQRLGGVRHDHRSRRGRRGGAERFQRGDVRTGRRRARCSAAAAADTLEGRIHARLPAIVEEHRAAIARGFPPYWRRAGGYRLDRLGDETAVQPGPVRRRVRGDAGHRHRGDRAPGSATAGEGDRSGSFRVRCRRDRRDRGRAEHATERCGTHRPHDSRTLPTEDRVRRARVPSSKAIRARCSSSPSTATATPRPPRASSGLPSSGGATAMAITRFVRRAPQHQAALLKVQIGRVGAADGRQRGHAPAGGVHRGHGGRPSPPAGVRAAASAQCSSATAWWPGSTVIARLGVCTSVRSWISPNQPRWRRCAPSPRRFATW